jgi:hypothetical protein
MLGGVAMAGVGDGRPGQQPPGVHSTIITSDGYVRDDELAMHIANEINAYGGQVADVKIILNTCYGGGFETEITFIFGPTGPCPGVPWMFASAAQWYEYAWAFRAEWCEDPTANLGSKLTSALAGPQSGHWDPTPGAMLDAGSNNVLADLTTAVQHDEAGPYHEQAENPVVTGGNGGQNIVWNAPGTSHEVILFGGRMDQPAYYNDMDNMQAALTGLYGGAPCTMQVLPNGTRQDLLDAISAACANLDANTQLLLHFTDHGGFVVDVVEHLIAQGQPPPYVVPNFLDTIIWKPPPPWPPWPKEKPPPPPPEEWEEPELDLTLLFPIDSGFWIVRLNDDPIPLPPGILTGELTLPVAWESFREGENHLTIEAVGEPSGPFVFDAMVLTSGPVAMGTEPPADWAVRTAVGYGFAATWLPGSATPGYVPAQVSWPEWTCGGPLMHYYSDPAWPDKQGFWGVMGPLETATLTAHVFNTDSLAEKQHVVITADIMACDPTDDAWNVVVQPPPGEDTRPPAAFTPQVTGETANADGSLHCTWEMDLVPVPPFENVTFTLKTGSGAGSFIFIDNITIDTTGEPKDKSTEPEGVPPEQTEKSEAAYYYFNSTEWPPEAHYEVLPTWYEGTLWDRLGTFPPEWLPEVTDHRGVLGLPGEFPADGKLMVHFDDEAELDGREHVSCQFDRYSGGGTVFCEPVLPPESAIENLHEEVEVLEAGWERVHLTYDVVPPPAWQEVHWLMFANGSGGAVAIDNFAMSSSTWWADHWHDAFDFHDVGAGLQDIYGWKGWDNNPAADAIVTDAEKRTPFHSVMVEGAADLVHELDAPAARWMFTTWQYVPADFESGCDASDNCGSYFILLNTYNDGGPYHWSVQLHADSVTGSFIRDQETPVSMPLITDQWVKIDVLIDLNEDWYRTYYDGVQLGTAASWTAGVFGGGGGVLDIAAVDLYANTSTALYYDDLYLRPLLPGDLNCDGDVNNFDISPFVKAVGHPEMYAADFPGCERFNADINGDGAVDNFDITPFVRLLAPE